MRTSACGHTASLFKNVPWNAAPASQRSRPPKYVSPGVTCGICRWRSGPPTDPDASRGKLVGPLELRPRLVFFSDAGSACLTCFQPLESQLMMLLPFQLDPSYKEKVFPLANFSDNPLGHSSHSEGNFCQNLQPTWQIRPFVLVYSDDRPEGGSGKRCRHCKEEPK